MIPVTFNTVATLQFGSEGHPTSLHFAIPEEWKTCKIRLHLRRSDGSFVPPMQLDENGCVKVDRSASGKTGGQWMLSDRSQTFPLQRGHYFRCPQHLIELVKVLYQNLLLVHSQSYQDVLQCSDLPLLQPRVVRQSIQQQ